MTELKEQSPFLTVKKAQELLQVSRPTINRLIKSGKVKYAKVGSLVRIHRESLEAYLREATQHT